LFLVSCSGTPIPTVSGTTTGGSLAVGGGADATGGTVESGGTVASVGGESGGATAAGGSSTGGVSSSATTTSDPTVCRPNVAASGTTCGPSGATCNSHTFVSTTNQTYCSQDSWTCLQCTNSNNACVTANCSDCCSGVFTEGKCIAGPCKTLGSTCSGSDCKDCCSGVGFNGTCVQCNANSDCFCSKACTNHQCVCTPQDQPCAYPNQNCQDCCSGYYSTSGTCTCVPSGTNALNNVCTSLTTGSTCGDFTMTFKNAPGTAAACCSGNAASATSCR